VTLRRRNGRAGRWMGAPGWGECEWWGAGGGAEGPDRGRKEVLGAPESEGRGREGAACANDFEAARNPVAHGVLVAVGGLLSVGGPLFLCGREDWKTWPSLRVRGVRRRGPSEAVRPA
jgi:hypothetical protein